MTSALVGALILFGQSVSLSAQSKEDAPADAALLEEAPVATSAPVVTGTAQGGANDSSDWREILPGLRTGSTLRFHTESRRNFWFDKSRAGNDEGFLLSRFRFGLTWEPTKLVTGVVELQDARIYGEEAINESQTPNIFADRLDIHQAFIDVRTSPSTRIPISMRAGRQKLAYGTQRLVSPLEWVNTARVFDGIKISIGTGTGRMVDGFSTRLVPVSPRGFNAHGLTPNRMFNSQFHGVYYSDAHLVAKTKLEGYWLLRREKSVDDAVHTIGARVDSSIGPWAVDAEIARQSGRYGGDDHRSAMVHIGGSYTANVPGRRTLRTPFPRSRLPRPWMLTRRTSSWTR